MSGRKNNLVRFKVVSSGDMAQNVTSPPTNIQYLDNVAYQVNYTGAPQGSLNVQVSSDYNQDAEGNVLSAGNWVTLTSLATPTASSPVYFDMNQMSAPWMRLVYLATSSDGFMDVWVTGKML